jgi:hypothetical protein
MWLTEDEEQWLRDQLKDEPEWLRVMVLENFGIYPPDPFGRLTMRQAADAMAYFLAPNPYPRDPDLRLRWE